MAPSHSEIILAAMDAEDIINDSYHFWNDVYGFKMSSMKKGFHSEALVDFTPSSTILSPPTTLKKINMNTDTTRSLDFSTPFSLTFNTNGWFSGFCGWFDILFDAEGDDVEKIAFSTGPHAKGTHWKQTMFIFEKGMQVDQGIEDRKCGDRRRSYGLIFAHRSSPI